MRPATVAILANPASGRDVRRLLANAGTSTIPDKVTVVRRVIVGAVEAGAERLLVLPDPHGLCRKALSTLHVDVEVVELGVARTHDERETTAAAELLAGEGAGAVVVLGGDGTNRAVASSGTQVPVVPLSTGTNNVFPISVEPTVAGAAAGLVAAGAVDVGSVARRAKAVRVEVGGEPPDVALVDAVLVDDHVGSRAPFDPATMLAVVLAIADPAAVGVSPLGGLLEPCSRDDDAAVVLWFGEGEPLRAPVAPGHYATIGIGSCRRLALGEPVVLTGPGVLAFDGDRRRSLGEGGSATIRVERDGPMVVDVAATLRAAAEAGTYRHR